MTNRDFILFVIEDRKVPYNDQILNLADAYFKLVIEDLEKKNNFNYMRREALATLLADNYYIPFTEHIKQFREVIDKQRGFKLLGDEDTKALYMYDPDKRAVPSRYYYSPSDQKLYFDCAVAENTDYILSYYVFTYNTNLVNPDQTHPLINENKTLLLHALSYWIERYFTEDLTFEAQRKEFTEALERSSQLMQRYTKTRVKFDFRRY